MRTIGSFGIFLGFFLVFALLVGLLVAGALALRSSLALLMLLPALPGLYVLYVRTYRVVVRPRTSRSLSAPR